VNERDEESVCMCVCVERAGGGERERERKRCDQIDRDIKTLMAGLAATADTVCYAEVTERASVGE